MTWVNGFVAAVPTKDRAKYLAFSEATVPFFKKHGALRVVDCWGTDVPDGKLTSFPMAVKANADETVVFSWVEWPSREVADKAMEAMSGEPVFDPANNPMPFDGQRMIYGGFEMILDR